MIVIEIDLFTDLPVWRFLFAGNPHKAKIQMLPCESYANAYRGINHGKLLAHESYAHLILSTIPIMWNVCYSFKIQL
jgi:predicted phosphoadenosine phosphosulfate sulfurtransferase